MYLTLALRPLTTDGRLIRHTMLAETDDACFAGYPLLEGEARRATLQATTGQYDGTSTGGGRIRTDE